jgi:predicted RNA-binding protein YlxR (DUF448 family)
MEAAITLTLPDQKARPQPGERRCLVTGKVLPKDELIRFVIGPDRSIVPDLAHNLPGRGLWVTASQEAIATAAQKNLFAKAAKASVTVNAGLADQVAQLMHNRCLDFIGLARRSGIAVLGQPQVEAALKSGKLGLLLTASNARQTMDNRGKIPATSHFTRDELGAALGHDQLVYVGLKAHALTAKLNTELGRLEKISGTAHISHGNE